MSDSDSSEEFLTSENTLGLLGLLLKCAILIPCVSLGIVYAYFWSRGHILTRTEWKRIIFYIWVGTMTLLTFYALRFRRRLPTPKSGSLSTFELRESQSPAEKWEQRSSRKILHQVYLGAIAIPLTGVGIGLLVLEGLGQRFEHGEIKLLILIFWLSSILVGAWIAFRSRRDSKLFG